eukprot:161404-Chlamydomonas_euryale.AAC.2
MACVACKLLAAHKAVDPRATWKGCGQGVATTCTAEHMTLRARSRNRKPFREVDRGRAKVAAVERGGVGKAEGEVVER